MNWNYIAYIVHFGVMVGGARLSLLHTSHVMNILLQIKSLKKSFFKLKKSFFKLKKKIIFQIKKKIIFQIKKKKIIFQKFCGSEFLRFCVS